MNMSNESEENDHSICVNIRNPDKDMTDVGLFKQLIKTSDIEDGSSSIQSLKLNTANQSPEEQLRDDCLNALTLFKERVFKDEEYSMEEKEKFSHMLKNLSLYCVEKASDEILNQILNTLKRGSECLEVNEVIETIFYSIIPQVNDLEKMAIPITKSVEKLIDCMVDEISITRSSLDTCSEKDNITYEIVLSPASPKEQKVEMRNNNYRDHESWTDDESGSSSSSSSSDFSLEELKKSSPVKIVPLKTRGELDIEDLPPVEELTISVKEEQLVKVGKIHGIVGKLVVIQALKGERPLNSDSVLFLKPDKPLGRIFEVFGPVCLPFYSVLFNSIEDVNNKCIKIGSDVFCCPDVHEMTTYVFVDDLRKQKGSDASWMDNNEPPDEFLDYSDDEQERAAKLKRRARNRPRDVEKEDDDIQILSNKVSCVDYKISGDEVKNSEVYKKKNYFQRKGNFSQPSLLKHSSVKTSKNLFDYSISNRSSPDRSTQSLDEVPIWISSPPPFLLANEPRPAQPSNNSPHPIHSFQPSSSQPHYVAPSSSQPHYVTPSSSKPQYFQPQPSPAYLVNVPIVQSSHHHPININQQLVNQHQFAGNNFIPPPCPPEQQLNQSNTFRPFNQVHTFGQISPMSAVSHLIPNPMFRPNPLMLVAQGNQVIPTNMASSTPPPVMSPNPYWQQREHLRSPLVHLQSPPPNAQINLQNPVFSNVPSPVSFTPVNNFSMPLPRHTQPNNFSFSQPTYRF